MRETPIIQAINARTSVRAFKPDPVPRADLSALLEACLRAPSWGNSQPWEFVVVSGNVLAELKLRLAEKVAAGAESRPDISFPPDAGLFLERRRKTGRGIFEAAGIARNDQERRRQYQLDGARFFDAPVGIIVCTDSSLSSYGIFDAGIVTQTIMLGALDYGLGTCAQAMVVRYPEVLRELLHIPQTKLIVIGIAVGYPDPEAPISRFRSPREPAETFITWKGPD